MPRRLVHPTDSFTGAVRRGTPGPHTGPPPRLDRGAAIGQDGAVDWIPLASTGFGAAIALGGTVMADLLRRRDERGRDGLSLRRQSYLDFILALGAALQNLRDVARSDATGEARRAAGTDAMSSANLYPARERFLMSAPPHIVRAAEAAFQALIVVRDAVRAGVVLHTSAYHDAYHPYAEKVWLLRLAIRRDVGAGGLNPADLSRDTWDDRAHCDYCQTQLATAIG